MSWVERVKQGMSIETGDGKVFFPDYMNAVMDEEFEMSTFNFRGVRGTLVDRGETKGRAFSLQLFFQGDDNLDVSEEFRISTQNRNEWRVTHPLYDELIVQPRRIKYDNRKMNVSEITALVLETIVGPFPVGEVSAIETIEEQKTSLDEISAANFDIQTLDIQPSEITTISEDIDIGQSLNEDLIETEENKIEFRNKVRDAQRDLTNITTASAQSIRSIQEAVEFPARTIQNAKGSIRALSDQLERLAVSLGNLTGLTRNEKVYFETQGSNLVSTSAIAAVNNPEGYNSRVDVDDVTRQVLDFYNFYIESLDSLQTVSQTEIDSYAPNPDVITGVDNIVNFTLSKLGEIAINSELETIVIVEADTNAIILSHRFYGLDEDDVNLDRFIDTNNIGLSEILEIKKDREVVYYK